MLDWKLGDGLTEAGSVLGSHIDGNIQNLTFNSLVIAEREV